MISFLTILDLFIIAFLTYVISYGLTFMISWYDKGKRAIMPVKDIKK